MVIAAPAVAAGAPDALHTALSVVVLVIIASWALFFAVLLIFAAVVFTSRGRSQRQQQAPRTAPARQRAGRRPAGADALRSSDPNFDEQLLLDAAQTATLLVFAAMTTGDIAPISRLVTASFWQSPFGKITQMTARDRRRDNAESAKDAASGRRRQRWRIPLDYHPSVPELAAVDLGREQRVSVRISFGQLQAIVRPGAGDFAAGAAAPNFGSAMVSVGRSVASQTNAPKAASVSWLASGGHYDLTFARPSSARTDPSAGLADRTCTACGATYQSELAIACEHCGAPRPLPWGNWRLAHVGPAT